MILLSLLSKYPIDIFGHVRKTIQEAIDGKKKYSVEDIDIRPYLNKPVSVLIADVFGKNQCDTVLIVNYTITKSIWRTRSISTGGYRYTWPYTEDGLNLDVTFALYSPGNVKDPAISRKIIEIEKKKMTDDEVVEKMVKDLNKKVKYLF